MIKPEFDYSKKYHLHIDADTIVFKSAAVIVGAEKKGDQKCVVTHKQSKRIKEFESFEVFNEWLKGDTRWSINDFNVNSIAFAIHSFNEQVKTLRALPFADTTTFYIGGVGNFRKELYPEYKANRPPKPTLFDYVYNHAKKQKDFIIVDGCESEDVASAAAFNGTLLSDPNHSNTVLCYIDKDLDMIAGWRYNYNKPESGVFWQDTLNAFRCLCEQLLKGDRTCDNIKGIDFISEELAEVYKFRKVKSVGDVTAKTLLVDCDTKYDLIERVCHIYQLSYGEDNWKKELDFTGKLVYISKYKDVFFNVEMFINGEM